MELGLLVVFLLVLVISAIGLRKRRKLPPGRFTIPYVGTPAMLLKMPGRWPHEVFAEEAKQLGNVFSFGLGNKCIVILNGYDAIHEAFVKNATACAGRMEELRYTMNIKGTEVGIIFSQYGDSLKQLRRFTLQALRDFGVGKTSLEQKIITEVEALTVCLQNTNEQPFKVSRPLQKLVSNVIFGIIFGKRWDFDDAEFDHMLQLTNDFIEGDGIINIEMFLPAFIAHLFKRDNELERKCKQSDRMRNLIAEQIDEHEKTFDNDNIRDFVDFYWRTVKHGSESDKKYITKENMFQIILDLFLAGSETTSVSLEWSLLYMTEFPDVQKKCQEELEQVIGRRLVTNADRKNLPYVEATLMEVQRMSTLAPLSAPHQVLDDVNVCGYDIPKGTILFANIRSACFDQKYWKGPEKFNPHRFLDASGKVHKAEALVPFSAGPRMCLGEPLARMEMFLVFSNLLQRFTFHRENANTKHSLQSIVGRANYTPQPWKLKAQCRS